jgi:hypothetical protein
VDLELLGKDMLAVMLLFRVVEERAAAVAGPGQSALTQPVQ